MEASATAATAGMAEKVVRVRYSYRMLDARMAMAAMAMAAKAMAAMVANRWRRLPPARPTSQPADTECTGRFVDG